MSDAKSQLWKSNAGEDLTAQEAESFLRELAQISAGDSALHSLIEIGNQKAEANLLPDTRGVMTDGMYRTLLEQLPVVAFMARLEGDFSKMYVSPQIESLLGYSQQEWLGNPVLWYERLHPEDKARWNAEFAHFLMLDEPFHSVYRFIARDGHVVWVRGDIKIVRNELGQPVYIQGIGYDISEIKLAEKSLKQAHDQLEVRIEERTAQLSQANTALREEIAERQRAETLLRQQASALQNHQAEIEALNTRLHRAMQETHHRVKNNLQIIAALIEMQAAEGDTTVPVDDLKHIGIHIQTLAIIHDILTKRPEQGGQIHALSAQEVLEKLISLLRQTAGSQNFQAYIEDASLSPKQCTALTIVINELVANAVKYGDGDIEIRFTVQGDQAILEVSDNGPGFPADFDPQTAANFGLDLVAQVSQADLFAEIEYANRVQGGARITIRMPLTTNAVFA